MTTTTLGIENDPFRRLRRPAAEKVADVKRNGCRCLAAKLSLPLGKPAREEYASLLPRRVEKRGLVPVERVTSSLQDCAFHRRWSGGAGLLSRRRISQPIVPATSLAPV
jgi:hypothetical protein